MNFRLIHLFVLMGASAYLLALSQYSPALAALTLIGLIPSLILLATSRRLRAVFSRFSKTNRYGLLVVLSLGFITIYVISVGPVVAMVEYMDRYRGVAWVVYWPVSWLHDRTFLEKPLEWYSGIWGWQ